MSTTPVALTLQGTGSYMWTQGTALRFHTDLCAMGATMWLRHSVQERGAADYLLICTQRSRCFPALEFAPCRRLACRLRTLCADGSRALQLSVRKAWLQGE